MKYFLTLTVSIFIFSCNNSVEQAETFSKMYDDSVKQAAEKIEGEKNAGKIKFPAYIYLDNPTSVPIIFQVGDKTDTLPPYVYEKQEIESGDNKLVIYNAAGETQTDTSFFTEPGQDILLNISHSNYYVLMLQYKDFDFSDIKSVDEMKLEEIKRITEQFSKKKKKKKEHEYPEPNPAGDQHRAYEKKTFKRPSTTTDNYIITQYYMFTRIAKSELIIRKYWDIDPNDYFSGSESLTPETHDAYLRQLVREKDIEIKQYFGSGESGRYESGDEISAIFNVKYINSLALTIKMLKSYDKKVIDEIKGSCKECEELFNTINTLSAYTSSTSGLRSLSADFNKLLKKYSLKDPWLYCNSKSEQLIKKYLFKEHREQISQLIRESVY